MVTVYYTMIEKDGSYDIDESFDLADDFQLAAFNATIAILERNETPYSIERN